LTTGGNETGNGLIAGRPGMLVWGQRAFQQLTGDRIAACQQQRLRTTLSSRNIPG
jgi:hypothetical protein